MSLYSSFKPAQLLFVVYAKLSLMDVDLSMLDI